MEGLMHPQFAFVSRVHWTLLKQQLKRTQANLPDVPRVVSASHSWSRKRQIKQRANYEAKNLPSQTTTLQLGTLLVETLRFAMSGLARMIENASAACVWPTKTLYNFVIHKLLVSSCVLINLCPRDKNEHLHTLHLDLNRLQDGHAHEEHTLTTWHHRLHKHPPSTQPGSLAAWDSLSHAPTLHQHALLDGFCTLVTCNLIWNVGSSCLQLMHLAVFFS